MCSFLRRGQDTEVLFRRPSFFIAVIRALVLVRTPQSSQRPGKRAPQRSGRQTLSRGWQHAGDQAGCRFLNHGLESRVLLQHATLMKWLVRQTDVAPLPRLRLQHWPRFAPTKYLTLTSFVGLMPYRCKLSSHIRTRRPSNTYLGKTRSAKE